MSKQNEEVEDKALDFDVMPGADRVEDDDMPNLDLSFDTVAEEPEVVEEPAEVVAEDAEEEAVTEDSEEAVAEDEGDEPEAELDEELEEEEPVAEEPKAKKKPMVPKARLDEVLAKQKALQKQVLCQKGQAHCPPHQERSASQQFLSRQAAWQGYGLQLSGQE